MKLQDFRKFAKPQVIQPTRSKLIIPAFQLAVPVWTGASTIIAEYTVGNSYFFSIRVPVESFGDNFIVAIRWVVDGQVVYRYKLFDNSAGILLYPVYDGEVIGLEAVIEIWSVNSTDAPILDSNQILESSVLNFPANVGCNLCCVLPDSQQLLAVQEPQIIAPYAYCNPFCLPLQVNI